LPATSLLATCYSRGHVEIPPPSSYDAEAKAFMDRLTTPVLEFAFDDEAKRVLFRGDLVLEGANFRLVDAMIEAFRDGKKQQMEVQHLQAHDLAEKLGVSEQSMRQQLRRLREAVEPLAVSLGIPMDQDTVIQTKERAGYRINPQCREVAIADIMETVSLVRNE